MSGKGHQVNNDNSGPAPGDRAAATSVSAGTEVLAESTEQTKSDAKGKANQEPHRFYGRDPKPGDHALPYDEHHGIAGAFVMVAGVRVPVQSRLVGDGAKKKVEYYIVVDGKETLTDRDGAPITK